MDFELGQIIKMKKAHPCGENRWEILRVGMDFHAQMHGLWQAGHGAKKTCRKNSKGFYKNLTGRRQLEPCFRLVPPGLIHITFPCISNLSML